MRWLLILVVTSMWAGPCEDLLAEAFDLSTRKDPVAAAGRLELASTDCRKDARVLIELARAYLVAGQFEKSLAVSSGLIVWHPGSVAGWRAKADAHYLLAQDDEAEASLLRALEIEPGNEDATYSLGRMYYYRSRYLQASALFSNLIARNPTYYKAWDNLGLCQEGMGQLEAARKSYLRSIALVQKAHPKYDWAYANLSALLLKTGENRQAFDLAVEAATRNPNGAQNFYLAGKALVRLDQWERSERWLVKAAELDEAYPEPHYLLGQVYRRLEKKSESQAEFLRFQELKRNAVNRPR